MKEQKIKKQPEKNIFKRLGNEFRKIRWATWKVSSKSALITIIALVFMATLFFGITIGLTELFKVMGIL
jgi:preprotein translocase subunit SecE